MWRYLANQRFLSKVQLSLTESPLSTAPLPHSSPHRQILLRNESYLLKATYYCIIEFIYVYLVLTKWSYQSKQHACKLFVTMCISMFDMKYWKYNKIWNKIKLGKTKNLFWPSPQRFFLKLTPIFMGGCMSCYLICRVILQRLSWYEKLSWKRALAMFFGILFAFSIFLQNL